MRKVIIELYLEGDEVNDEAFGRALGAAIVNHGLSYFPAEKYATPREIGLVRIMERMEKVIEASKEMLTIDTFDAWIDWGNDTNKRLMDALKELEGGEVTNVDA